jgi:hypothetical protein
MVSPPARVRRCSGDRAAAAAATAAIKMSFTAAP